MLSEHISDCRHARNDNEHGDPQKHGRPRFHWGFSDAEFGLWMKRHAVLETHKDELARLTEMVSTLLLVFERVYRDSDSRDDVVQRVLQDQVVGDWMNWLVEFYDHVDANQVWNVFPDQPTRKMTARLWIIAPFISVNSPALKRDRHVVDVLCLDDEGRYQRCS